MTPERFRQIEKLARAALEQSTSERTTFLDAACDDPKLRSEVDRLLESYGQVESFLEMPAFAGVADVAGVTVGPESGRVRDPADRQIGPYHPADRQIGPYHPADRQIGPYHPADRQIGPYAVIREIGQGGMGTVYLAARRDDEYHRRVAIKLLRRGMNTAVVVRRFRSERQILSNLDHPHIARLFEGGTTRDGRPYFVMEYIDGVPLDAFCDQHRLPIRERLLLFLKVCSAVQYAHQNLVVHRDIKPSNILVTEAGEPKLLDFGIAKVLDPEAFPLTVEVTESGLRPMTPHYASPEQIAGDPITTASDVYSLGVLLYKLLTGRRPYRLTNVSPLEAERELRNEPVKPSTALGESPAGKDGDSSESLAASRHRGTSPVGLYRQLVGDLDNIVLMALRREPQRRYSSAEKMSEDVRRHLDGLPVVACRDHFGYRLGKFLRRHRLAVVAAATVFALIVGSAIALAFQAAQIAKQRDIAEVERRQAELERDKARQVSEFLVEIFEVTDPNSALDTDITAREVLDRAADSIGQRLQDQPEIAAALRHALGRVYHSLGLDDQARPLLDEALRLRLEIYGPDHLDVASSLHHLAEALYQPTDGERAQLVERAIEVRRAALGENHPLVAESLTLLSFILQENGDKTESIASIERAITILEQQPGPPSPSLAKAYLRLGALISQDGDYQRAESLIKKSIEIRQRALGSTHPDLAVSLNSLANNHTRAGNYERAEPFLRRALEINRKALGDEHPVVGSNLTNLGIIYRKRGDYRRAETCFREALAIREKAYGKQARRNVSTINSLAILAYYQGNLEQAESYFQRAIEVVEKTGRRNTPSMAFFLNNLGLVYRDQGKSDAESVFLRSIEIRQGFENQDLADDTRNNLASLYLLQKRTAEARWLYERVGELAGSRLEENAENRLARANLAAANLGLGKLLESAGDDAGAAEHWQRTVELLAPLTAATESLELLDTHAVALLYLGRVEEARPLVEELQSKKWLGADFLRLCRRNNLMAGGGT